MAKKKLTPGGARIFGIFFCGFACLFLGLGAWQAWSQGVKLLTWLPVEAQVTGGEVKSRRGSKGGTNYRPVIQFTYRVDGIEHSADTPLATSVSTSDSGWARGIVARFPAGSAATAYYNPRAPAEAFLVREANVLPYVFLLFPMIHICVGLGVWWFAGSPGLGARAKARRMGAMTVLWDAVGSLALVHYIVVGGTFCLYAGLAFGIYFALGAVPVLLWVRFLRQAAAEPESLAAVVGAAAASPSQHQQPEPAQRAAPANRLDPENPFRRPD